jgi:PAS domain S-box-containing protein
MSIKRFLFSGYGVAILSTSAILLSIEALQPALEGAGPPLLLFLLAVMLASWCGGAKAGLWATLLSVLLSAYFLEEPLYSFSIAKTGERIRVLLLAGTGGLTSLLIGTLRRAEARALERVFEKKQQLREEAEFANGLIQSLPGLFYLFDAEGRFLRWNRNLETVSGYSAEEIERTHPLDLLADDQRDLIWDKIREVFETGSASVESWLLSKGGQRIPFHFTGIKTSLRGAECLVGVGFNLTDRNQAETTLQQTHRLLEGVVNNTHLLMAYLDADFNFIWVNRAYARACGHEPEFFPGRNHFALYSYADNEAIFRRVVDTGSPCFFEAKPFEFKDQPERGITYWDWGLIPIEDDAGQVERLVFTLLDVTARVRAEQSRHEIEQRFRRLVEVSSQIVWVTNAQGEPVEDSPSWRAFTGRTYEQWVGWNWLEAVHPEDRPRLAEAWRTAVAAVGPYRVEFRLRHAGGEYRHMEVCAAPISNADGSAREWIGMNTDITERKRAEQAIQRLNRALWKKVTELETLLDVAPIGLAIAEDSECRHIRLNATFARLLNVPPEINASLSAPPGERPPWTVLREGREVPPEELPVQKAAASGQPVLGEDIHLMSGTGQSLKLLSYASPLFDAQGKVRGAIGAFLDVTEQWRLEDELAWRAARLEDADRRKDEFLAMLGHELRNPLAPIRNGLHLLRKSDGKGPSAGQVQAMLERQVDHLVRLVDDLLDVSRITRGKIKLRKEPVDLVAVLDHALDTSQPLIQAGGHTLSVALPPEPVRLKADPVRLAQVFTNLLNNAAKYMEAGGHIWLAAERQDQEAIVSVRDSGVGIPAEALPRVFDLFTQIDCTLGRAQGGLGIGLALVRHLVQLHGGRVEAHSEGSGQGSEFIVRLPLAEALPAGTPEPEGSSLALRSPRRLLVVDDNRDAADSLGLLLESSDTEVRVAYDGPAALAALTAFQPEVVLLDLGMPGMDGCETARHMRQHPAGRDITLIALTGWGQDEDRRRTRTAGFDHHLTKPADLDTLQTLLASLESRPQEA